MVKFLTQNLKFPRSSFYSTTNFGSACRKTYVCLEQKMAIVMQNFQIGS